MRRSTTPASAAGLQRLRQAVESIKIGGGCGMWRPVLRLEPDFDGFAVLRIRCEVPDRITGQSRYIERVEVQDPEVFQSDASARGFVVACLRGVFEHEIDESISFGEQLVSNPHADEPKAAHAS